MGVAAGTYPVRRTPGEALVRILADGTVEVASSSIDMGTGHLYDPGADRRRGDRRSGRSRGGEAGRFRAFPARRVAGGSQLARLMTGAVHKAALAAREELIGLAINDPRSPFREMQANTLVIANGRIASPRERRSRHLDRRAHAASGRDRIEALRDTLPAGRSAEDRYKNYTTIARMLPHTEGDYSRHSWCAHFIEVRVDEDFGTVRVARVVSALDSGRLYNPKLAESQWKGGIIMGIGQALLEEGIVDRATAGWSTTISPTI